MHSSIPKCRSYLHISSASIKPLNIQSSPLFSPPVKLGKNLLFCAAWQKHILYILYHLVPAPHLCDVYTEWNIQAQHVFIAAPFNQTEMY